MQSLAVVALVAGAVCVNALQSNVLTTNFAVINAFYGSFGGEVYACHLHHLNPFPSFPPAGADSSGAATSLTSVTYMVGRALPLPAPAIASMM